MSKANELAYVGDGLILGCLNLGVDSITSSLQRLESAFLPAWAEWPTSTHFSRLKIGIADNDVRNLIFHGSRRQLSQAYWIQDAQSPDLKVQFRDSNDRAGLAAALRDSTGVSNETWTNLAEMFLRHLHKSSRDRPAPSADQMRR